MIRLLKVFIVVIYSTVFCFTALFAKGGHGGSYGRGLGHSSKSRFSAGKLRAKTTSTGIGQYGRVKRDHNGKIVRSRAAKKAFLKKMGLKKVPEGYQVDHIKPLAEGGCDCPENMQLLPIEVHKAKTQDDIKEIRSEKGR